MKNTDPHKHLLDKWHQSERFQKRKAYQAAYDKERREKLKELGLCPRCGRNPVQNGRYLCPECMLERNQFYGAALEKKDMDAKSTSEKRKAQYRERKQQGICVRCGKEKAQKNSVECSDCIEKTRQYKAIGKDRKIRDWWERAKAKASQHEISQ